ncbi:HAD hydrolase-like protein [Candidatus Woesearchaeota archaeon]|jgi:FMN phosphatase YigB (HAD superfamily)|nr:HAD hydrolase-like protein [Candidatus Woesearchaeota archaeon]
MIIGTDLSGTLIKEQAAAIGHKDWFRLMSTLLEDPSVALMGNNPNYFLEVFGVMSRYTGLNPAIDSEKKLMTKLARNLFQMCFLKSAKQAAAKNNLGYFEYLDLLKTLKTQKKDCKIALITTTPQDIVNPLLKLIDCEKLFDHICKSDLSNKPNKKELLDQFQKQNGKLTFYVGNEYSDYVACTQLGITCFLINFDSEKYKKSITSTNPKNNTNLKEQIKIPPQNICKTITELKEKIETLTTI